MQQRDLQSLQDMLYAGQLVQFDIPDLLPKLQVLISAMQDKAADT